MKPNWTPELLAPAGNLEKLKVAVLYGADAVYLGGQEFGLRSAADNFTNEELAYGVAFAHKHGRKVYITLNGFLHDKDLDKLEEFLMFLEDIKVDAAIVSDLGVIKKIKEMTNIEVHLSTQASCLNSYAAKLWKKMGVSRIVLGREVSIQEAKKIKDICDIEIEMFIHGSMCMAYSGNCVISNYTQGRDSNRGGCAHSCRFEYSLESSKAVKDEQEKKTYFMSSKDLEGIRLMQDFVDAGIDSLKVEGRMKTNHYVATISKVYSDAINFYKDNGHFLSSEMKIWEEELRKIPTRGSHTGSLEQVADENSAYDEREGDKKDYQSCGVVLESKNDYTLIEVKSAFNEGDELEIMPFDEKSYRFKIDEILDIQNERVTRTKPGTVVKIPYVKNASAWNIVRVCSV